MKSMRVRIITLFAVIGCGCTPAAFGAGAAGELRSNPRLNVLLLTADDLGYESLGVTGCNLPGITPNLDRLAAEGIRFEHAHVTVSVCQPCREVLLTGRYPHNNGAVGFVPIRDDVPTLNEVLVKAGYRCGILGKSEHLQPREKFHWALELASTSERSGREPADYHRYARAFFEQLKAVKRPFFFMANATDPHRPWPGTVDERRVAERFNTDFPRVRRTFRPEEVPVPPFLPDLPATRAELAGYYASVFRCDETIGATLRALDDAGLRDSTVVMFLSDHGMAFPFAKGNCYRFSTRTPWMVRWPGRIKPGAVDRRHLISGVDFVPTILEILGLPAIAGMDGRSFVPLLEGGDQSERDYATVFYNHSTGATPQYLPMRAVHTARHSYVWNPWSDGTLQHRGAASYGETFAGMIRAGRAGDARMQARVDFCHTRTIEEFYDMESDPGIQRNLISDSAARVDVDRLRNALIAEMRRTNDPLLPLLAKESTR